MNYLFVVDLKFELPVLDGCAEDDARVVRQNVRIREQRLYLVVHPVRVYELGQVQLDHRVGKYFRDNLVFSADMNPPCLVGASVANRPDFVGDPFENRFVIPVCIVLYAFLSNTVSNHLSYGSDKASTSSA